MPKNQYTYEIMKGSGAGSFTNYSMKPKNNPYLAPANAQIAGYTMVFPKSGTASGNRNQATSSPGLFFQQRVKTAKQSRQAFHTQNVTSENGPGNNVTH